MTAKKVSILVFVAVAVVAVGIGSAKWFTRSDVVAQPAPPAEDRGPVIATVDGAPIYLAEVRSRVSGLTSVHGGTLEQALGTGWKDELFQSLVDDQIVQRQAGALGITVSDSDARKHVDKIAAMFQTEQGYSDWLSSNNMSEAQLLTRVRLQTLASLLYLKVTETAAPTAAEVRRYFEDHRQDYLGVDGKPAPLIAVKDQIDKNLEKKARDLAYAEWLKNQRGAVKVVVIDPTWWRGLGS